jgi:rfaE bifunctional protein nucleotidyltransferase chain/domain/rfaE bifunctional protein kinase chain/domain
VTASRRRRVVVVGDALLDRDLVGRSTRLCPDAPVPVVDVEEIRDSPGGAGLTALLCVAPDTEVTLVAPVARDDDAALLTGALRRGGVDVVALGHAGGTRRKTRVRAAGQSLVRVDEGGPGSPVGALPAAARAALEAADVVLVSDYGAGTSADEEVRALVAAVASRRPVVWDPHPRGAPPVPGCVLVTPNLAEARAAAGSAGRAEVVAAVLRQRWEARGVCVTVGADGAWLATSAGEPVYVPAPPVAGGDPCGAGDRFAASAALALARGAVMSEAVVAAVTDASAWVAAGGAAAFSPPTARDHQRDAHAGRDVVARVRAGGGTVVATGGCFDVLHAGHVACLDAARRLGDALVVLLNSDASVRRLKGPDRPVHPVEDRARVLRGLSSVDDVVVFDEDDPRAALDALRPDVWAKGGDYGGAPLPEADLVRSWGGRVVLLPYLSGRSTTTILERRRQTASTEVP